MAVFESLIHCKSQCLHLWRQQFMIKYLERTFMYALQLPLVGRRHYCAEKNPQSEHYLERQKKDFFKNVLGISLYENKLKLYHAATKRPLQGLKNAMQALENEGIQKLEIYNNLRVLELRAADIKLRSRCLREFGFAADVPEIIKYWFLLGESTETLHQCGLLPQTMKPFENIVKNLACPPEVQAEIRAACMEPDQLPLLELRKRIMQCLTDHYIGDCNGVKGLHWIIKHSCASNFPKIIKFYTEVLEIPIEIIRNHGSLLRKYPEELTEVMKVAEDYNLDLKSMVSKNLGIIKKDPAVVALICRKLYDYGITPEQVMYFPAVFRCSMKTITDFLLASSQWQDFSTLKLRKNFLVGTKYFKASDLHVLYLKKAGFERYDLDKLTATDSYFRQRLCRGEDTHSCKEVASYICNVLDVPYSDVIAGLRHHPIYPDVSMNNVKEVLIYLTEKGFTQTQILNGIALVLYPRKKVAKAWNLLPNLNIVQPFSDWVDNDNILHLLLYFIEKGECTIPTSDMELTDALVEGKEN